MLSIGEMPSLKECSRSAAVSFSPLGPHLAAGTVAGVIDMSFSTTSVLEVSCAFLYSGKAFNQIYCFDCEPQQLIASWY